MDAKVYLKSYGWQEGEALQKGGLKRPILVQHKKDTKGLGHSTQNKDGETWWENLFDGHLKNLEVTKSSNSISFSIDEQQLESDMRKNTSPLYRMFVKGEGLAGTVGQTDFAVTQEVKIDVQEMFEKQKKLSLDVVDSDEEARLETKLDNSSKKRSKATKKSSKKSKSSEVKAERKKDKTKSKITKTRKEKGTDDDVIEKPKDKEQKKGKTNKEHKLDKTAKITSKSKRKATDSGEKFKKRKLT